MAARRPGALKRGGIQCAVLVGLALGGWTGRSAGAEPPAPDLTRGWRGARARLEAHGVDVALTLLVDHSTSVVGGLRRGGALRLPLDLRLNLDGERLAGLRGARAELGFRRHSGRHATEALVGDLQGFDNVDAAPFADLLVAWYEQSLFGSRLRVKLGKADANTEFASTEHGGAFLHSAAGYSPAIVGFPSYPAPAPGVSLALEPRPWIHLAGGIYWHRGRGEQRRAAFQVAEAGLRWRSGRSRAGRLAAGVWQHGMPRGEFEPVAGDEPSGARAVAGTYGVLDQELWHAAGGRSLALFAQLGRTPGAAAGGVERHLGLGLAWTGPLRARDQDVVGLLVSTARLRARAPGAAPAETAFELLYAARLAPWLGVTTDVQLIANPGGRGLPAAVVASVRAEIGI
jgi:carbohydrate-selective porin OprB